MYKRQTDNRNNQREPIDRLFVTPGLKAEAAGYKAFGVGCPSDHRVFWADFTYEDAFGVSGTPLVHPGALRLYTKLSLIPISEPTRQADNSYVIFTLKQ